MDHQSNSNPKLVTKKDEILKFSINSSQKFGVNNLEVTERLLKFLDKTGCDLIQSNGQRRYGPPPTWIGPPPPRGCEIFIGKLPRDCFEDELVPAFEKVGPIFEMRLMMDFNGMNRGYGFVKYCKLESANRAVMLMDEYEIRPGKKIGVSKSVDNCRLFIGNINLYKSADNVMATLSEFVEGIVRVIMYPSVADKKKNRGFVFVEFETHRLAAMARRVLKAGGVTLWDQRIIVDWAEPEPEVDPKIMNKIQKLYIRNLDPYITEEGLRQLIESLTSPTNILRVKKLKDYAFIHFKTRAAAEFVISKLPECTLNGQKIDVSWARPPMYSKTRIALPHKMSLCLSLPPRLRNVNRTQQVDAPAITPVVPAVPSYYCYRQPQPQPQQYIYPYSSSGGASNHSTGSPTSSTNHTHVYEQHQQQPVTNYMPLSPPNNIITQQQQTQMYLSEQLQNLYISSPPSIEQPILSMPYGSTMHLPPPVPVYYSYFDRPQPIH